MHIAKYGKFWAVFDGEYLVCVCAYKKGAQEVLSRLKNERCRPRLQKTRKEGVK